MNLPNDPILLLSVINTKLRDFYSDLDALCEDINEDRTALETKLTAVGYVYDKQQNQFVAG
jgi:hypothetical protein